MFKRFAEDMKSVLENCNSSYARGFQYLQYVQNTQCVRKLFLKIHLASFEIVK